MTEDKKPGSAGETGGETPAKKKRYVRPRLDVYGSFLELTQTKRGTHSDGTGKPATRVSGGNA
jgi:hypothetical protein